MKAEVRIIPNGYKQTDIGVIPVDWEPFNLGALTSEIGDGIHGTPNYSSRGEYFFINGNNIRDGRIVILPETKAVDEAEFKKHWKPLGPKSLLLSINGTIGNVGLYSGEPIMLGKSAAYLNAKDKATKAYLYYAIQTPTVRKQFADGLTGTTIKNLGLGTIRNTLVPLPPSNIERESIAEALSDVDALIGSLEQMVAKKLDIKQGAMQELLTGKKRLPGFSGEWNTRSIEDIADCLDNLRIPLNDSQRVKMRGFPYCGANGVLDYINRYCVDDSVILMAEDGGYFDEYMTRPIAYRMSGKFWVNNHAHILKAKPSHDQDFLYYSLVHKNILSFLASGTRAKLNKSELNKITIRQPCTRPEQTAIATILSDMDAEIAAIETTLSKARQIKQGMMQELLTGRIRLV